ncbi:MAG TPA: DUF5060 domain-containing protein [Bryobacteraceae bacterium]|nr:DUF5060 domain-containing protein [Bryobacteraceae bacterium]
MGLSRLAWPALFVSIPLAAQTICAPTPAYSPCEVVFELSPAEAAAHPNPYKTVELRAEFRSPRHRTFLMPAFWDGGPRMVIRFTPTEPGAWDFRVTSNLESFNGKTGQFSATESEAPGFVRVANVHHFAYTTHEGNTPHLWMGDTLMRLALVDDAAFRQFVDARASQKFTHIRASALGTANDTSQAFPSPDGPDLAYFRRLDERVRYIHQKGMTVDLLLAAGGNQLRKLFPNWEDRARYVRFLIAHYAGMNVTWGGVENFEEYDDGRGLLKEIGTLLKQEDPYQHVRSTGTHATSAGLLDDGWMDFVTEESAEDAVGAIEHQLYPVPFVNMAFAGKPSVKGSEFRRRLWNAAMNGQYVTAAGVDDAGAAEMKIWFEFFSDNRHWELEPYFDVDGGRAVALEEVEYIAYVDKPGPVEVRIERHGYDTVWLNPANGETVKLKDVKAEHFAGEPPDRTHDWVLHLSREGHKQGMLKSYKFESRRILMQEVEVDAQKVPFQIAQPAGDTVSLPAPPAYAVKLTRETHATRSVMYLWTAEIADDSQGYRVIGTGEKGTFQIDPNMARRYPAVFHVRLFGINANGKVYSADRTYQLTQ